MSKGEWTPEKAKANIQTTRSNCTLRVNDIKLKTRGLMIESGGQKKPLETKAPESACGEEDKQTG